MRRWLTVFALLFVVLPLAAQTRRTPTLWFTTDCSSVTGQQGDTCHDTDDDNWWVCEDSGTTCSWTQGSTGPSVTTTEITNGTIDALDLDTEARTSYCFNFMIEAIATTDEIEIPLPPWAGTMTDFRCEAQGGTSFTVNLCDGEDLGDDTCSTSILGSTLACTTSGANDNSLSATGFAALDSVSLVVTAVSGTITFAQVSMVCTRD